MKIFVWHWGRFGTGSRYAFELAQALREYCGYETLLSLAEGAELMQNSSLRGTVDLPLYTYANTQEFLWRSFRVQSLLKPMVERLRATPPDAAIVTMMGYWDIFIVRHLHRLGVPVVVIAHDAEMHPGDSFPIMIRLQRRLVRDSDGVITLTNFVADQFKRRVSLDRKIQSVIPHVAFANADLDLSPPAPPEPNRGRPLRLLMAGRLKRYKGLDLLTGAFKHLSGLPVTLRVVGASEDPSELAELAQLPNVEFDVGWKDDRAFLSHVDWADACVLPYIEASQSGIAPLSFSRGRAVVATPVGGLPEQVRHGETGLLTETVSAVALATSIKRLAEDRNLTRCLGENALRHAETEISWAVLAPRFAAVLEAVMQRRAQHGETRLVCL